MAISQLTTILFDLDGTLLPLDHKAFVTGYFQLFHEYAEQLGYDEDKVLSGLQAGFLAMLENRGEEGSNKERFDRRFSEVSGIDSAAFNEAFAPFYEEPFHELKAVSFATGLSKEIVTTLTEKGYTLVLATAPLFPWQGTHARIRWAGLEPEHFVHITTYEDCFYTKPHLSYYTNLLDKIDRTPVECMMVGNDVQEDLVAEELSITTYLVIDCLLFEITPPLRTNEKGRSGSSTNLLRSTYKWNTNVHL